MKKIVYLPLDERPCNYDFPILMSEGVEDFQLITIDKNELGLKKSPARFENIENFLMENCVNADYLIVSLEMLLYGGLVPSRLHFLKKSTLVNRLSILKKIKKLNPSIKIYGFALVMRCPTYTSDDEEPDYYGICGKEIHSYGVNEHKYAEKLIDKSEYIRVKKSLAVCEPYLDDYLSRRKKNLAVLLKTLKQVGVVFDDFTIMQDDSAPFGYTTLDQQKVVSYVEKNNLNVKAYPGCDETGLTLLAKILIDIKGYSPKFATVYPDESCKNVIPLFEDREFYKSVGMQIVNAGATLSTKDDADILLYCNLPVGKMQNINILYGEDYTKRNLPKYTDEMLADFNSKKHVALADVAYSNGGDKETADLVEEKIGLLNLAGYAGWNTSSNTLGTVICQAIFHHFFGATKSHKRFTALRVFEDLCYNAFVREQMKIHELDGLKVTFEELDGERGNASKRVFEYLNEYAKREFPAIYDKYEIKDSYMPWNRMFEVALTVKERD